MSLVTSKEMLLKAQEGGYAVGAFNAENMEMVKAIIQAAKELLTGTPMSVESIAEEVGFGSESYFCKQFRRYEGITPTAFRNARRLS